MLCKNQLTGITLIRNGTLLNYPYRESISSLATQCNEVLVNVGHGDDDTEIQVSNLQKQYPNIRIFYSNWDMKNTGDGFELARQVNLLLPFVNSEWVVYLQADEFLHWEPHHQFYKYLQLVPERVSQIELYRTYFWKDLKHRAPEYELYLGRIFRPGTHIIGGDGMHLVRLQGEVERSGYLIYHYSRMGTEEQITKRIRTLDGLFHDPEVIQKMEPFSFSANPVDLIEYSGTHPVGVEEFYRGKS